MSGQRAQSNVCVFHSYVVISPSVTFRSKINLAKLQLGIVERAVLRSSRVTFAYAELMNVTLAGLMNDALLLQKANDHLSQLMGNTFTSVSFYGDKMSEYSERVARTAQSCEIRILNKSEPDSTMDRYLKNWMKAPRTPP